MKQSHSIRLALTGVVLVGAALTSGCASLKKSQAPATGATAPVGPIAPEAEGWRKVATEQDRERVRNWYRAWKEAHASVNAGGYAAQALQQGVLLRADAALPNPHIPPGDYRCRTIKLGSKGGGTLSYVAYPYFKCRVRAEENIFSFVKLTGSQRPNGLIFDDTDRRQIFLGTEVLGDERGAIDYGVDKSRDRAALVERIGPNRWRLVFPYPAFESIVDVMEVVP
mgnify:CR=1 FL=1